MKYIDIINKLENFHGASKAKWRRNLRRYLASPGININDLTDAQAVGYYQVNQFETESDTSAPIVENIIRSAIETLISKIASKKVRPYYNLENGDYHDMQVVKSAQQFTDLYFHDINLNKTIVNTFRDACIFDRGIIYVDKDTHEISRVMPWQIFIDPRENSYGKLTKIVWKREQYPVSLLPFKLNTKNDNITLYKYYDLIEHKEVIYIPETSYYKEYTYDKEILPFYFMWYETPIKGSSATSIVDLLYGIQTEVDYLNTCIKDASQRGMIQKYFVPESSNVKVSKLTNRAGEVITYTPIPGQSTVPVLCSTDPMMDPQWLELMEKYKEDAFELVGLTQMSVTGQKPMGLDSGAALSTMESIESDRFETQLNTVVRAYVEIAKMCFKLFDPNDDILPPNIWRKSITWGDMVKANDMMSIQFSAADFLSNDPSIKIQQINNLVMQGYISRERAGMLMEIPDLEKGYSLANNAINAVLSIIDDCLNNDSFEIPDYIPTQLLKEEIINTCLSLRAASSIGNKQNIDKLMELYKLAEAKNVNSQTSSEMMAVQSLTNELNQAIESGALQQQFNQDIMQLQADNIAAQGQY